MVSTPATVPVPADSPEARRYNRIRRWLGVADFVLGLALMGVLLATGWSGADGPPVTVTIGVAAYPAEAAGGADLVRAADRRLYAGKEAGRNRVVAADDPIAG